MEYTQIVADILMKNNYKDIKFHTENVNGKYISILKIEIENMCEVSDKMETEYLSIENLCNKLVYKYIWI